MIFFYYTSKYVVYIYHILYNLFKCHIITEMLEGEHQGMSLNSAEICNS